MDQKNNNIARKSGRYPWGTNPKQVVEVEEHVPCDLCGKLHIEHSINGHLAVPHFCESCWKKVISEVISEFEETKNES